MIFRSPRMEWDRTHPRRPFPGLQRSALFARPPSPTMAQQRALSAPPAASGQLVPYGQPIPGCPVCGADVPDGQAICDACWFAYGHGVAPRAPQEQEQIAQHMHGSVGARERLRGWRHRLDSRGVISPAARDGTGADASTGGVHSPAGSEGRIGCAGVPLEGVSKKITVGAKWLENHNVVLVKDLKDQYPGVDWSSGAFPVNVARISDASGKPQHVVLTKSAESKPMVQLYCRTEVELDVQHLSIDAFLRPGQGDEFFRKLKSDLMSGGMWTPAVPESDLHQHLGGLQTGRKQAANSTSGDLFATAPIMPSSGGAVSPAESGARRLRAQRSDPEPPEQLPPKKPRGADASSPASALVSAPVSTPPPKAERKSRGAGTGSGGGKLRRADVMATPLTIANVLNGTVTHPKVQLGWRRNEKLRGGGHKSDTIAAEQELQVLTAAIKLLPEEIAACSEAEITEAVGIVEGKVKRADFPSQAWLSLMKRAANKALARKAWPQFLDAIWAWRADGENWADMAQMDPLRPSLRAMPESLFTGEVKASLAADYVIKDALAVLMSEGAAGVEEIRRLVAALAKLPLPSGGADSPAAKMSSAIQAISALVLREAIISSHVAAVRELGTTAPALASFLEQPFWQGKIDAFWSTAADEVCAGTQMDKVMVGLSSADAAEVTKAWGSARGLLPKWKAKVRAGAVDAICQALLASLEKQAEALKNDSVADGPMWLSMALSWLDSARWLGDVGQIPVPAPLQADVQRMYDSHSSEASVAKIAKLMADYAASESQDSIIDAMWADIKESPAGSQKLAPGGQTEAATVFLHGLEVTNASRARVAHAVSTMVDAGAVSPGASVADGWARSLHGWDFSEMALQLGKSPPDEDVWKCNRAFETYQALSPADSAQGTEADAALADAVGKASEALRTAVLRIHSKNVSSMEASLAELTAIAGGKAGGGSWKGALPEDAPWTDVEREARYYFREPVHKALDKLFKTLEAAKTERQKTGQALDKLLVPGLTDARCPDKETALMHGCSQLEQLARRTHTEPYFLHVIWAKGSDRQQKIQGRIEKMSTHGVSSEDLQPSVWRKALALATSR